MQQNKEQAEIYPASTARQQKPLRIATVLGMELRCLSDYLAYTKPWFDASTTYFRYGRACP